MNKSKRAVSLLTLPLLFLLALSSAFAQPDQMESSYEVSLQVVIGSMDAVAGVPVPANLSPITKQLKGAFPFTNYRLANTFVGRISNTGNIEYKSVSNILGQENDAESQSFLDWSMGNFRAHPRGFQARPFRFGARVPVRVGTTRDDTGKITPIVNYEAVGLTMSTLGLPANTPTLIGTISLPKTTGTIFLVATIKSAEL